MNTINVAEIHGIPEPERPRYLIMSVSEDSIESESTCLSGIDSPVAC